MTAEWSSPAYRHVADFVRERTGLVFPEIRVRDVESSIRRAAARRGLQDVEALTDVLRADEQAREAFVAELTIGETYFQRDPAQFDLLRWRVLPELLEACAPDRPIRVWSAGCASGEEPYSVAMVFEEMNAIERAVIIGTDIARPRLEEAQRGLFSKWSLRSMSDRARDRYFAPRGKYFELAQRIRERVDFRYLNLAEDTFPSLSTGIWGMDVILCRNVLIYFDRPTVERVARRLLASLSEHGWLILGASDPAIGEMVECDVVVTDAGLVYRRAGAATEAGERQHIGRTPAVQTEVQTQPSPDPAPEPPEADIFERLAATVSGIATRRAHGDAVPAHGSAEDRIVAAYQRRDYAAVREIASDALERNELSPQGAVAWLRTLANLGCLEEAARVATDLLERHGPAAELLYLHGVILLQTGRPEEAAALCRRALYLDRNLIVAHMTLAEALRRVGQGDGARRALRNAVNLLAQLDRGAEVPASDGETAGRLGAMARMKLQLLEEAA